MRRVLYLFLIVAALFGESLSAQTYKVLYNFGDSPNDSYAANQGVVSDSSGNLYGTNFGDPNKCLGSAPSPDCGVVFELSPIQDGTWVETILYTFCTLNQFRSCFDGSNPAAGLVINSAGNLYGTTQGGGNGRGVVFQVTPSGIEAPLYAFSGSLDGAVPLARLTWDSAGNLYGTTSEGGQSNGQFSSGTVFELSPDGSGWTETILHNFTGSGGDGGYPVSGVAFDATGNLYGTTQFGGIIDANGCNNDDRGCGVVYKLSPNGPDWSETIIAKAVRPVAQPTTTPAFDRNGAFYASFVGQALYTAGLFGLFPKNGGGWTGHAFRLNPNQGAIPKTDLLVDNDSGAVFGAAYKGGGFANCGGCGSIFEAKGPHLRILHRFCAEPQCPDGSYPGGGGPLLELNGKIYGTTTTGGSHNQGVVFELTP